MPDLQARYQMRMFGDYLTLTGSQWLDLHDLVCSITKDGQEQRARIRALLDSDARTVEANEDRHLSDGELAGAVARIRELEDALDKAADHLRSEGHYELSAEAYAPLETEWGQS